MQDTIKSLVEQFWSWIGITLEKVDTIIDGEDVNIHIQTPDSALIIGMHWKSLDSFNHILSRIIEKITGSFVHVHLEVNDYMKSKDERLFRFLDSKINTVMSTGKSARIQNLNSYDRKKAHNYISLKNIDKLTTHSEWAPNARELVLEYTWELVHAVYTYPSTTKASSTTSNLDNLSEDGIGI